MAYDLATAIVAELNASAVGVRLKQEVSYYDIGTATATNPTTVTGAATISKPAGIVTTNVDVNSAAAGTYTLTLTNTLIAADSLVQVTVGYGTATTGYPVVQKVTPGSGTCTIVIGNAAPVNAFNGSLIINFHAMIPLALFAYGSL